MSSLHTCLLLLIHGGQKSMPTNIPSISWEGFIIHFYYLLNDYIHHLTSNRLYSSFNSIPVALTLECQVSAGLTGPLLSPGLALVYVVSASWRLPCEWCQQRGGVWYHTTSDRANMTASHGPAPSEWPGTSWHPSAPSPSIWQSRNSLHKWLRKHLTKHTWGSNHILWMMHTLWSKIEKHTNTQHCCYLHILEFF